MTSFISPDSRPCSAHSSPNPPLYYTKKALQLFAMQAKLLSMLVLVAAGTGAFAAPVALADEASAPALTARQFGFPGLKDPLSLALSIAEGACTGKKQDDACEINDPLQGGRRSAGTCRPLSTPVGSAGTLVSPRDSYPPFCDPLAAPVPSNAAQRASF